MSPGWVGSEGEREGETERERDRERGEERCGKVAVDGAVTSENC